MTSPEAALDPTDPRMLVQRAARVASRRKVRLFGVACCRLIADHLPENLREILDEVERAADQPIVVRLLHFAERLPDAKWGNSPAKVVELGTTAMLFALQPDAEMVASAWEPVRAILREFGPAPQSLVKEIATCVLGNVGKSQFEPTWRTSTVLTLARLAYDSRDFGNLPILADAVEEAGCGDGALLDHLREPVCHVRGCWAVDHILGKV